MLGKPHLAGQFDVARLVDGLVAFECGEAAAGFAAELEALGYITPQVAESDSHKLFREVGEVRGLVVYFERGAFVPPPQELAALLQQRAVPEQRQ